MPDRKAGRRRQEGVERRAPCCFVRVTPQCRPCERRDPRRGLAFWRGGRQLPLQQQPVVMGPCARAQLRTRQRTTKSVVRSQIEISNSPAVFSRSFTISPHTSREFCCELTALSNQGRRECRTLGASAATCAVVESTRVSHHGHAGNVRHSPRNGFNGFLRALPGDRAFLPPSPPRSCFSGA